MEDLSAKELKEILTIGLYVLAAILAIASKLFRKRSGRRQEATKQFDFPNAEPEHAKPVIEVPKPRPHKKKRVPKPIAVPMSATVSAEPETRKYFTYEDEAAFESSKYMSATKSATAEQSEELSTERDEPQKHGSSVDFDLRAAVIASEILKPKFEE